MGNAQAEPFRVSASASVGILTRNQRIVVQLIAAELNRKLDGAADRLVLGIIIQGGSGGSDGHRLGSGGAVNHGDKAALHTDQGRVRAPGDNVIFETSDSGGHPGGLAHPGQACVLGRERHPGLCPVDGNLLICINRPVRIGYPDGGGSDFLRRDHTILIDSKDALIAGGPGQGNILRVGGSFDGFQSQGAALGHGEVPRIVCTFNGQAFQSHCRNFDGDGFRLKSSKSSKIPMPTILSFFRCTICVGNCRSTLRLAGDIAVVINRSNFLFVGLPLGIIALGAGSAIQGNRFTNIDCLFASQRITRSTIPVQGQIVTSKRTAQSAQHILDHAAVLDGHGGLFGCLRLPCGGLGGLCGFCGLGRLSPGFLRGSLGLLRGSGGLLLAGGDFLLIGNDFLVGSPGLPGGGPGFPALFGGGLGSGGDDDDPLLHLAAQGIAHHSGALGRAGHRGSGLALLSVFRLHRGDRFPVALPGSASFTGGNQLNGLASRHGLAPVVHFLNTGLGRGLLIRGGLSLGSLGFGFLSLGFLSLGFLGLGFLGLGFLRLRFLRLRFLRLRFLRLGGLSLWSLGFGFLGLGFLLDLGSHRLLRIHFLSQCRHRQHRLHHAQAQQHR